MQDPLQKLMGIPGLETTVFPPSSRYYQVGTQTFEAATGEQKVYLKRRLIPQPDHFSLLQTHRVVEGDRLDNLAHQYWGDAEQYWRLCDANAAIRPDLLTETVGRRLRITLPEGIPGI